MEQILFSHEDEKGREFIIKGDIEHLRQRIQPYLNVERDNEEYGLDEVNRDEEENGDGRKFTVVDRLNDEAAFNRILLNDFSDWFDAFEKIPMKKNGTFAKGRVVILHRGESYRRYWEDAYGFVAPALRLKTLNDYETKLEFISDIL